jgi:hypothetical protein
MGPCALHKLRSRDLQSRGRDHGSFSRSSASATVVIYHTVTVQYVSINAFLGLSTSCPEPTEGKSLFELTASTALPHCADLAELELR